MELEVSRTRNDLNQKRTLVKVDTHERRDVITKRARKTLQGNNRLITWCDGKRQLANVKYLSLTRLAAVVLRRFKYLRPIASLVCGHQTDRNKMTQVYVRKRSRTRRGMTLI